MTTTIPEGDGGLEARLARERNVWFVSPRPDGSPHLTPIWFVWDGRAFWVCTSSDTAKARNLRRDPRVALALQDGDRPVVAEGRAIVHARPYPEAVVRAFRAKFDWDITATDDPDGDFEVLVEIVPARWLLRVP
ncbi:TIGR03618 family F420-dependent PPOX class oxidoreductase [Egicoccus sp. AB-alg2]|uniref:TIGR03618 family F420-dependent PPOX class oxidoreductase n=1 Tax=Egicoccus sp. AB-alg2 TaxID=3242693 RepID=UPI00359D5866